VQAAGKKMKSGLSNIWYLAYTRPQQERVAEENLVRQQYHVRLPLVRKVVRRQVSLEPLFPRYIFFRPSSEQQSLSPVRSTLGVSSIVRFGMELATITETRCDQIMAFAQAQQEGGLESLLGVQGIKSGDKVLVKSGPFSGLEGLVSAVAKDRVLVLMSLLGKEQSIGFEPTDITAA
jgi:transcriptional antiterminator RfaH